MSSLIIEGGIYLLLLLTPFAFGGIEAWAQGIIQILSGLIVAVWAWRALDRGRAARLSGSPAGPAGGLAVWVPMIVFLLVICFQLVPLPPGWIQRLSPGADDLYRRTLPGYAEGHGSDSVSLPSWLLATQSDRLPASSVGSNVDAGLLNPPGGSSGFAARSHARRTLSIYVFETRQRLAILLCYVGLFAVAGSYVNSKERLARLLAVAVFSGFAVSLFGIIQKLNWNGKLYWIREGTYINIFGPFVNRNNYAAFAGTVLPVAVCMGLHSLKRMEEGRRDALPHLLLWSFAAATMAGGIFYSLSRGGILSTALSFVVVAFLLIYFGARGRDLAVLAGMMAASAALLWWIGPEKVVERVGTLSEGQNVQSMTLRLGAWKRCLGLIADHPAFGTGLGTFRYGFMRYAPPGETWWTLADNEYVELICDTGLVGGGLLLAGFMGYLLHAGRPARIRGSSDRYAYTGIAAGLFALLIHSVVSANLQMPANALLLAVLGAALLGVARRQESRSSPSGDSGSRPAPPWAGDSTGRRV